jgi:putative heme-binding domain-containing protein
MLLRILLVLAAATVAMPAGAWAQHETAADLLDGERAYGASCTTCHGPDGNVIPNIDFSRGLFRREMTDEDLVRIIRTGIPGTAMPATSMTVEQAQKIVAFLRSMPAARRGNAGSGPVTGDVARGRTVFTGKGGCTACHRIETTGSRVGPDLTRIGQTRRAAEIEKAILEPGADVQPANRSYRVVARDGTIVTGRLLNHDTYTVQLLDSKEQLRTFVKADAREHGFIDSPMPSYRGRLTPQEIADVVSYLASLKAPPAVPTR